MGSWWANKKSVGFTQHVNLFQTSFLSGGMSGVANVALWRCPGGLDFFATKDIDSAVKPRSIGNLLNTGLPKDVKSCTMRWPCTQNPTYKIMNTRVVWKGLVLASARSHQDVRSLSLRHMTLPYCFPFSAGFKGSGGRVRRGGVAELEVENCWLGAIPRRPAGPKSLEIHSCKSSPLGILPKCVFRVFEEYIARDVEGNDIQTRRWAAIDLVRSLRRRHDKETCDARPMEIRC